MVYVYDTWYWSDIVWSLQFERRLNLSTNSTLVSRTEYHISRWVALLLTFTYLVPPWLQSSLNPSPHSDEKYNLSSNPTMDWLKLKALNNIASVNSQDFKHLSPAQMPTFRLRFHSLLSIIFSSLTSSGLLRHGWSIAYWLALGQEHPVLFPRGKWR